MSSQRWLIRILDGLIVLLVAWLLAAAAYVSLGRQFVPAIADYRQELIAWAQDGTDRFITLEALSGEMQGWQPVLEMHGLRVHEQRDAASPTLLALDNVTARIDIWSSLWEQRLVMDALQIEGLALELVEEDPGRWQLHGLGPRRQGSFDLDTALNMLFEQRRITLLDTRILVSPHERPQWVFQEGEITLLNGSGWHRLDGRVKLPDGQQLRWQFSGLEEGERWQDMSVGFFIEVPPIDWVEQLPPAWLEHARLQRLVAGGQFWGSWQAKQLDYLRGRLDVPQVRLEEAEQIPEIKNLNAEFAFNGGTEELLEVQGLAFELGDQTWPPSRLRVGRDIAKEQWLLQADQAPLGLLARMVPRNLLSEPLASALDQLAPSGALTNVTLQGGGSPIDWKTLSMSAMLEDVGVEAWQGAPAIQGISGSLAGSPFAGELRVDSRDWSMHLPRLFPQSWSFRELGGSMEWRWSEADGLRLNAPGMRAAGEQGKAAVSLQLDLPGRQQMPTMDLRVSLADSRAQYSESFVPRLSPAFNPRLGEWLTQARIEGAVPLAVFEYQGSLRRDAEPGERSLSLYARLESGSLAFQPDWPRLESVSGTLRMENQQVRVDQAAARVWETDLDQVQVVAGREQPDDPLQLRVQSDFAGPLGDGLRLMQETPLAAATGETLKGWEGEGNLQGQFKLDMPLRDGAAPLVDANWSVRADSLSIPPLQSPLGDLAGQFSFTTAGGLRARDLSGLFLGSRVLGSIDRQGGRQVARFSGRHTIEKLKSWPLLADLPSSLVAGDLAWEAQGSMAGSGLSLRVDSDLQGITIDLPGALGKTAGESLPSGLTLTRGGERESWRFNLGADFRGVVETGSSGLQGDVRYRSGEPMLTGEQGLSLAARFEQLRLADWQQWLQRQRDLLPVGVSTPPGAPSTHRSSGAIQQIRTVELRAADFNGLGQTLDNLAVSGVRNDQGWLFDIDQARVRGQVTVPDRRSEPVALNMQRVALERRDAEPRVDALASPLIPEDPLVDVDPRTLPPLNVDIDTLFWGADAVGEVRFQMRPADLGARITDLALDLRGLRLEGELDWYAVSASSQFRGAVEAGDIGEVLQAWGYAPTVTSRRFSTTADLVWSGSPAFFALSRSSGGLQLDARNGTLQSGEGSADALRVFGLLNFNALTRRLRLDFSDLFGRGTAYDTLTADLALTDGVMSTRSPLVMDGPGAKMQLDGQIDLPARSIDMGMLVTLPVTNNLPLAAIIAGAPYIGGALFLADKILGDRVARFASVKYRVSGDWQQPTVDFERAFDNEAALEE